MIPVIQKILTQFLKWRKFNKNEKETEKILR